MITGATKEAIISAHNEQAAENIHEKETIKKLLREQLKLLAEKQAEYTVEQLIDVSIAMAKLGDILMR